MKFLKIPLTADLIAANVATMFAGATVVDDDKPARYTDAMTVGMQAGDFLEMPWLPSGEVNRLRQADFDRMVAAGVDFFRIPANLSARADIAGVVPQAAIDQILDQGRMAALALTNAGKPVRVVYDPNHHNNPRRGSSDYVANWPAGILQLTQAQHAQRDTAFMLQFAKAIKDHDLGFSIDLFNEPSGAVTLDGLNAWYADVAAAIRATGGLNADRMLWLETLGDNYRGLVIPPGGNIGVSPHIYSPFSYTHEGQALTDMGLTAYLAELRLFKAWAESKGVDYFIGEAGAKATAADRPEYISHLCRIAHSERVATCLWDYATGFGLADTNTRQWKAGMLDALAGKTAVRAYPEPKIVDTTKGALLPGDNHGATFENGVLTVKAFPKTEKFSWRFFTVLFPAGVFKRAGRITPVVQTPLLMQVMAYKAGAKPGEYVQAVQKSDGKSIPSGYRAPAGVGAETSEMEEGAFIAVYVEQVWGTEQDVKLEFAPGWAA